MEKFLLLLLEINLSQECQRLITENCKTLLKNTDINRNIVSVERLEGR